MSNESLDSDPYAILQAALRESYLENVEHLKDYAEKVKAFNRRKKAVREYLAELRRIQSRILAAAQEAGVDLCRCNADDLAAIRQILKENAQDHDAGEVGYELCIPNRVPPSDVETLDQLKDSIRDWEQRLNEIGEDGQLANVDMQNWLQKVQQSLQMLSNVSKIQHDSAMSIIRNMKG